MVLQSFAAALACLALLYTLMPKLPKGLPRLLLLLPCLPVFAWVPFSTHSPFLRSNLSFSFLWMCPSKLLLLARDLSPESSLNHGFLYFVVTTVLPVHVKGKASTSSASAKQGALLPNVLTVALFLVVSKACSYKESLSHWQIHALYCLIVFLGLEMVLGSAAMLASVLLGVETYPHSDNPFMASSLSEFWSRRWNLVASHMLRLAVYAPVLNFLCGGLGQDVVKHAYQGRKAAGKDAGTMEGKPRTSSSSLSESMRLQHSSVSKHHNEPPVSSPGMGYGDSKKTARHPLLARAIAMVATFLVSGLMHELIFGCINQAQPTWEVTMFFLLHGFATVLEGVLRRELPSGWKLPRPVAIFCTLGFMVSTAAWLFMPPITRSGSDVRIVAELNQVQSLIVDLFKRL